MKASGGVEKAVKAPWMGMPMWTHGAQPPRLRLDTAAVCGRCPFWASTAHAASSQPDGGGRLTGKRSRALSLPRRWEAFLLLVLLLPLLARASCQLLGFRPHWRAARRPCSTISRKLRLHRYRSHSSSSHLRSRRWVQLAFLALLALLSDLVCPPLTMPDMQQAFISWQVLRCFSVAATSGAQRAFNC